MTSLTFCALATYSYQVLQRKAVSEMLALMAIADRSPRPEAFLTRALKAAVLSMNQIKLLL